MKTYVYNKPYFKVEELPDGQINTTITKREKVIYQVETEPGFIIVNGFRMKVKDDCEFVYKLQKTQIKAIGGEKGLFGWIFQHYPDRFRECMTIEVLKHIVKCGKK